LFPPTLVSSELLWLTVHTSPLPLYHHSRSSSRPANTPNAKLQAPDHASHHHLVFSLLESSKSAFRETNYRQASGAPSLPSNTTNLTGAQTLAVIPPIGQIYLYCRLHSALDSVLITVTRAPTSLSSSLPPTTGISPLRTPPIQQTLHSPPREAVHTPQPCQTRSRRRP
jgi:hypothetical protein